MTAVPIVGTLVDVATFEGALSLLESAVACRRPEVFGHATVHSVTLADRDPAYRGVLDTQDHVLPDGMPLVWVQRLSGHRSAERVHGDDLFLEACRRFRDWRHFLLGGTAGQCESIREGLHARFPGLRVAGLRATPNRPPTPPEEHAIREAIRVSSPDVVWVGMGTPAQDHWMHSAREWMACPMVGVGSAFDLVTGLKRPAPDWMKRAGLQWLHRLAQEPRRLSGRYLVGNTRFIIWCTRRAIGGSEVRQ